MSIQPEPSMKLTPKESYEDANGNSYTSKEGAAKSNMMIILRRNLNQASAKSALEVILSDWENFRTMGDTIYPRPKTRGFGGPGTQV